MNITDAVNQLASVGADIALKMKPNKMQIVIKAGSAQIVKNIPITAEREAADVLAEVLTEAARDSGAM